MGTYGGKVTVIGRRYFVRQAATLVEFAQSTNDPKLAAALVEKAANLLAQIDESSARSDLSRQPGQGRSSREPRRPPKVNGSKLCHHRTVPGIHR